MPKMRPSPAVDMGRAKSMEHLPDWLVDVIMPEDIDPADALNPMGMMTRVPGAKEAGERLLDAVKGRFSPEMQKVLQFAQQRYPRLFGQLHDIIPIDNPTQVGYSAGTRHFPSERIPERQSMIGLNEKLAVKPTLSRANVFGHELHHSAERLARENFDDVYQMTRKLPNGYHGNSAEMLANIQGEKFAKEFDDYLAAGESLPTMKEVKKFKRRPTPGSMAEFEPVEGKNFHFTEAELDELDKAQRMMPRADWLKLYENMIKDKTRGK